MEALIRYYARNIFVLALSMMFIVSWLGSSVVMANGLVNTGTSGSLGYIYRSTSYSSGDYDNQHLLKANIDNTFFIWRNWFITGNSNLVFSQEQTISENGKNDTFSTTGQLGFSVLPQSSTPFVFSYSRSDSRVNSDFKFSSENNAASLDDNVVNDSLVFHQSLLGKGYRLKVRYSDDQFNSSLRGRYGASKLGFSGLLRGASSVLRASITQKDEVTYDKVDRKTRSARMNHNYTGFQQTTISTVFSSSQIQQTLPTTSINNSSLTKYDVTLNQASMFLTWRSLDKKMTVTSGLRFSGIDSAVSRSLADSSSTALSANLGLVYRLTQNLTVNASSTRVVNEFAGGESTVAQDKIGLNYRSDEIQIGHYAYDWRLGADLGRREDDGKESNNSTFSLGHGIGRKWTFVRSQQIYVRGSQDYSINSLIEKVRQRLSHRVSLGWKQSLAGITRRMQLQMSDQRDLGDETMLQTLSVDVDQQMQLTRRIKLNGSLNYQLTNYQYAGSSDEISSSDTSVASIDGSLSYINPFSVAGLVFTSNYRYTQSVVTLQRDQTAQQTWSNKLNYRVGKIDVSLQYLYREARKISYNGIYFNVKRVF
ncbi:hypothetical protein MNBD_GAMMA03-1855 [hydrothermal vent metagenome]|uniref:Uncharacterized protein n=1 Tax=hydrothermal vent metagenome TaxID=652676 RepID=A0A3B0W093_9ZZZZ